MKNAILLSCPCLKFAEQVDVPELIPYEYLVDELTKYEIVKPYISCINSFALSMASRTSGKRIEAVLLPKFSVKFTDLDQCQMTIILDERKCEKINSITLLSSKNRLPITTDIHFQMLYVIRQRYRGSKAFWDEMERKTILFKSAGPIQRLLRENNERHHATHFELPTIFPNKIFVYDDFYLDVRLCLPEFRRHFEIRPFLTAKLFAGNPILFDVVTFDEEDDDFSERWPRIRAASFSAGTAIVRRRRLNVLRSCVCNLRY